VLAHFKGVSTFLEATTQRATCEKEEAIYCPCKVCNNNVMYLYTNCEIVCEHLMIVVSRIFTSPVASMVRHNQGQKAS
jgi:hypothetical protein